VALEHSNVRSGGGHRSPLLEALLNVQRQRQPDPGVRILLVEDSLPDVRMFREALTRLGLPHELHVTHDGEDALLYLRQEGHYAGFPRPDIVVLDLKLPRLSGDAVLAAMSLDRRLQTMPVLVLTHYAEPAELYSTHLMATHVVSKQVGVDKLAAELAIIERLIATAAPKVTAAAAATEGQQHALYAITPEPDGKWLVEPPGSSGFSFKSLREAEAFAASLARQARPSLVRVLRADGAASEDTYFE
jgi:CheY-like chemotaxis protein